LTIPAILFYPPTICDALAADDKTTFVAAAKLAGDSIAPICQELAEKNGFAGNWRNQACSVVADVDRPTICCRKASAILFCQRVLGGDLIERIKTVSMIVRFR